MIRFSPNNAAILQAHLADIARVERLAQHEEVALVLDFAARVEVDLVEAHSARIERVKDLAVGDAVGQVLDLHTTREPLE